MENFTSLQEDEGIVRKKTQKQHSNVFYLISKEVRGKGGKNSLVTRLWSTVLYEIYTRFTLSHDRTDLEWDPTRLGSEWCAPTKN